MLVPAFIGAVGLLSTAVEAAPRSSGNRQARDKVDALGNSYYELPPPMFKPANMTTTTPVHTSSSTSLALHLYQESTASDCPTASVLTSTTTVDITVYVTASSHWTSLPQAGKHVETKKLQQSTLPAHITTTSLGEEATSPANLYPVPQATKDVVHYHSGSEEPCTTNHGYYPVNMSTPTGSPAHGNTWITTVLDKQVSTEPCPTDTLLTPMLYMNMTTLGSYSKPALTPVISPLPVSPLAVSPSAATPATTPCDDATATDPANVRVASPTPGTLARNNTTPASGSTIRTFTPLISVNTTQQATTSPLYTPTPPASVSAASTSTPLVSNSTSLTSTQLPVETPTTYRSTLKISSVSTEPCPNGTATASPTVATPPSKAAFTPYINPNNNTSSSAVSSSAPSSTTSDDSIVTPSSDFVTTPAPAAATSETCVIDSTMTPVSTAVLNMTTTIPPQAKATICEHTVEDGKPAKDNEYCGVQGRPAGTYFIAEFIEERSGVPVSLEGCYQFCSSVLSSTHGCQSYHYYENDLGAPRCDLYGMPVPWSVYDIDSTQPGRWYDLGCGSPLKEAWHSDGAAATTTAASDNGDGDRKAGLLGINIGGFRL